MKCEKLNYIPHKVTIRKNNKYLHYRNWFQEYEKYLNNMLNITIEIIESRHNVKINFDEAVRIEFLRLIYHSSSKYYLKTKNL